MQNIDGKKMKTLLEKQNACAIDVDPSRDFDRGHIKGSVNISFNEKNFQKRVSQQVGRKSDNVILYGSTTDTKQISKLAKDLEQDGFQNVYAYHGNLADWSRSGLEVQRPS